MLLNSVNFERVIDMELNRYLVCIKIICRNFTMVFYHHICFTSSKDMKNYT